MVVNYAATCVLDSFVAVLKQHHATLTADFYYRTGSFAQYSAGSLLSYAAAKSYATLCKVAHLCVPVNQELPSADPA